MKNKVAIQRSFPQLAEETFSKENRLRSREDFSYLKKGASRQGTPLLVFYLKKSRIDSSLTRIGLGITKKVGKAPKRNRLKRLLRNFFRTSSFKELGLDIFLYINPIVSKKVALLGNLEGQLLMDVETLFKRVVRLAEKQKEIKQRRIERETGR